MNIQAERLAETFTRLCEIDSPSRQEGRICAQLRKIFTELDATEIIEDESSVITGSECGNLIARFPGDPCRVPVFFSCHMDTVRPAQNVKVKRSGDLFTSQGDTILGSDDKSGIAACIEAMQVLREQRLAHRPVELIITTCEEIGLLGAKALDPGLIRAKEGYALDSTGFGKVLTHAPALNHLTITVNGVAAHAGLHPELGINAILLAAEAMRKAPGGRIDDESTVNLGTILGGTATNIVADKVQIQGEVRSHSNEKLAQLTRAVRLAFTETVDNWPISAGLPTVRPSVVFETELEFPAMALAQDASVVRRIERAARSIGMELCREKAGGGSDANIFNNYGLSTAILATGMTNVHTTAEQVTLQDMCDLTRLLLALLTDNEGE